MVEFEDKSDKYRVLRDGPWNFDQCLLLVCEFNGNLQKKDIRIIEAFFWIRVYDLTLMAWNENIGKLIKEALEKLKEIDLAFGEFEWGEFMHLWVSIDIIRPLMRSK